MQSTAGSNSARETIIPLDPHKRVPLHWAEQRKRRVHRGAALALAIVALLIGIVIGQLLPTFLG